MDPKADQDVQDPLEGYRQLVLTVDPEGSISFDADEFSWWEMAGLAEALAYYARIERPTEGDFS